MRNKLQTLTIGERLLKILRGGTVGHRNVEALLKCQIAARENSDSRLAGFRVSYSVTIWARLDTFFLSP